MARVDVYSTMPGEDVALNEKGLVDYALHYPFRVGTKTLFLGAIIMLLSVLILPFFSFFGYMLRVAGSAGRLDEELPVLDDPAALFQEGVRGFAALLPLIVAGGVPYLLAVYVFDPSSVPGILLLLAYTAVIYVQPVVFVRYAVERDWRAAYDMAVIRDTVVTSYYLSRFLLLWALVVLLTLSATVLAAVSVITLVGPFVIVLLYGFYYTVFTAAYWGRMLHDHWENG